MTSFITDFFKKIITKKPNVLERSEKDAYLCELSHIKIKIYIIYHFVKKNYFNFFL